MFAYIGLPVVLFLALYCHSFLGVVLGAVAAGTYFVILFRKKKTDDADGHVKVSVKLMVAVSAAVTVWCFLGGQGGLYYQSSDWNLRNAIFRDLITIDWPVVYEQYDKALVYYISYWLPAALVGKAALAVCGSAEIGFFVGNIALWTWTALGMFLVDLLVITIVQPRTGRGILFITAFLVFFSGMDIVGVLGRILLKNQAFASLHLEWWIDVLQFSSLTTCLFWVFNQAVIPWLVTLCLVKEKSPENYVYLGACAFASGPIPFMGIFVYLLGLAAVMFVRSIRRNEVKIFLKDIFSLQNMLFLVTIPPYLLYYMGNYAVGLADEVVEGVKLGILILKPITLKALVKYAVFVTVELGVYLILIFRDNKKQPLYYITWLTVLMSPFFVIGTGADFVMRFSIPAVMLTAVLVLKYLFAHICELKNGIAFNVKYGRYRRVACLLLCLCLLLGSITPLTEFIRGYTQVLTTGKINCVWDDVQTLNREPAAWDTNFVVFDYQEALFFKYIAS